MLPSHKTSISYLEHCRLAVTDRRLTMIREENALEKYWSIPYGSTACLLLGPGTSMSHEAAKFLASEGMLVGFVGGDGAPLYFASQNEYRPTEYIQSWCSFWYDANDRLMATKSLMMCRARMIKTVYTKLPISFAVEANLSRFCEMTEKANDTHGLLVEEAILAKALYRAWSIEIDTHFKREQKGLDLCNKFLDRGNYLAYGMASTVLWILGIPHGLPLLHGNTRRGALVFDLADVVKDACIMPAAFLGAAASDDEAGNRTRCIASLDRFNALSSMFDAIKEAIDAGCHR